MWIFFSNHKSIYWEFYVFIMSKVFFLFFFICILHLKKICLHVIPYLSHIPITCVCVYIDIVHAMLLHFFYRTNNILNPVCVSRWVSFQCHNFYFILVIFMCFSYNNRAKLHETFIFFCLKVFTIYDFKKCYLFIIFTHI